MSALVRVLADRPAIVAIDGCDVFVSVHDAEHLRIRSEAKRTLALLHPDVGGSERSFRHALTKHEKWLASEKRFYESIRLEPPLAIPARIGEQLLDRRCCDRCGLDYVVPPDAAEAPAGRNICAVCRRCRSRSDRARAQRDAPPPPAATLELRTALRRLADGGAIDLVGMLHEIERRCVVGALDATEYNRKAASRLLSIPRTTLIDMIRRHRISRGVVVP